MTNAIKTILFGILLFAVLGMVYFGFGGFPF
jgi:hypothetical protein